jgi:hypothetical protein
MKITINGETFDVDFEIEHVRMSFAMAIEKVAGTRYVQWETDLVAGGAAATAALVCLAWQRDGRDVQLQDILDGKVDLDFSEAFRSIMKALAEQQASAGDAAENPTPGAETSSAPDGMASTPGDTRRSSPRSSTSARGRSGSSPLTSSTT